jgi:hypothetical protein
MAHRLVAAVLAVALAGCSPGGGAVDMTKLPPRGSIWFGQTFDHRTYVLSGRADTFPLGSSVAAVAVFSHAITSDAELWVTLPGPAVADSGPVLLGDTAHGDVWGDQWPADYFCDGPGPFTFAVKDAAGGVLATGSFNITPPSDPAASPCFK